ncbi:MAG: glycoside hydrolase family 43 protein [Salinivirgaceae bacterium]|nr:glycoside hydrolase family 43 protein [Salinivirgaceae bacterium]
MIINIQKIFLITSIVLALGSYSLAQDSNYFYPGTIWPDNENNHINAHGGGILFFNNTYYWFGEFKTSGDGGNTAKHGISCYSSTDLYHWKNEGIVLKVVSDSNAEITSGCIIERPKVIFNPKNHEFVMWFHLELKGQGYGAARTGIAVSQSVTGSYTFVQSFRPNSGQWPLNIADTAKFIENKNLEWWTPEWRNEVENGMFARRDFQKGQMSRDMTLFVDDDGKAYHIHSSEENLTIHISELTDDYRGFTGKWIRVFPGGHNEAPALFKRNGNYYMITSGCTGWDPNAARLAMAESIWGPWKSLGNPCQGVDAGLTFHSQSTFVLPVKGKNGSFIFMADRWVPSNPIDGRYIWLPIEFESDKPYIRFYEKWSLDFFVKE